MSNEELNQRNYLATGKLKGTKFGDFEELNIGATSVRELKAAGVEVIVPSSIKFAFAAYKPLKTPGAAKPDRVFLRRHDGKPHAVATAEHKAPTKLRSEKELLKAAEQGLFAAASLGAAVAVTSNGQRWCYVDVKKSLDKGEIVWLTDKRDFGPGVLANLLAGDAGVLKDPAPLAETVWQTIWHATKEEPKQCLLTFVEIFVLKFLSDNLPLKTLPEAYRFYPLLEEPKKFQERHGTTAIEYYVTKIRPFIKSIFPDNSVAVDEKVAGTFGLSTVVSKTSIINGFAFLRSSTVTLSGFNRTFLDILDEFQKFGPLTTIDPEFKLRLYETFLRRSARQQKLGQFFTPRNVVRQMIRMARLDQLPDGAVVLDPAAGVGGFVLEPPLIVPALAGNVTFAKGKPKRRIRFVGVDVDASTHILAKANTLIHFAEAVRDPTTTVAALNQLMAETFVLMNTNETLGALENPPEAKVDVILTNPPYVTKGSGVYKEEVREAGTGENNVDLRDYYDRSGLGVEALFLRYISGALKPGGRAFVIVPLGLLNRTDPGPKKRILDECNLIASIALPRNTFFNTAQLTYILALEKRHTAADERPDVFCGIARTIGETLSWERVPTPNENDLADIAGMFVAHAEGKPGAVQGSQVAKVVPAAEFTENDRWDVGRFWTEEELVALGHKESAVTRVDFIDETRSEIEEISTELAAAKKELEALTSGDMRTISMNDTAYFAVRSGTRVTGKEIREHPGKLPIYSCFKTEREVKGLVDEKFFGQVKKGDVEKKPIVTVNANGASVGKVFVRRDRCGITDDVIIVDVKDPGIDLDYLAVALRAAVYKGGFLYEAKLFTTRVRELEVEVPVDGNDELDVAQQQAIASAVRRFDALRTRLQDLGQRSADVRAV
ncbi:N-6 DNA methylase [Bradyrhizobium sp. C-145]|uniref:N-6 DNA methylase n=1 Tax=Bradyrhizobium sp. C-145 TaxID=574727 RepID=UPI00201B527E|nr:N-6 DNA methylase [Bradyrhizobium sp. C-145]UQR61581.1 N-6 DNA methylase [Bradyrhizobium sp. C-145]